MLPSEPQRPSMTRLVGRTREEAELERVVAALGRGEGSMLLLSGPRGIGKSRLLTALVRRAARAGARVAAADGADPGPGVRYGAAASVLEPLLAELPAWQLRRVGRERLAMLAAVLAPSPPLSRVEPHPLRWRRHRIFRDVLRLAGDERPLLVAMDDLHAADSMTIELFGFLLRRAPVPGVALAAVVRPDAMPDILRGSVYAGARDEGLIAVVPSALAEYDVADLVGGAALEAARAGGGNPARVRHLAAGAPLGELLALEWAELDDASARLLEAGAVLGQRFDVDVAAEVAGLPEAEALAALDALAARGLVGTASRLRTVAFVDERVREAIDERSDATSHRAAAAALRHRAAPLSALARHVARGAEVGDLDAVALLVAAAETDEDGAVERLVAARGLLPHDAPGDDRAAVLVPLARALLRAGRTDEARVALADALTLDDAAVAAHREGVAELLVALGVRPVVAERGALGDAVAPRLRRAMEHADDGDMDAALREARAARDDDDADAPAYLAFLLALDGELGAARDHADTVLATWRRFDDARLAARLDVVRALGAGLALAERFDVAADVLERGVRAARRFDVAVRAERLLGPLADVRRRQGRLDAADAYVREALDASPDAAATVVRLDLSTVAVAVALDRGHVDAAVELGEAASALARGMPRSPYAAAGHGALAAARLAAGHAEPARCVLPAADAFPPALRPAALALRARVELALGDLESAVEAAEIGRRWAEALGLRGARADVSAAQAQIALARAEPAEAVRLGVAAHRLHSAAGEPVAAASDLLVAAEGHAAEGATAAAEERLREAHALAFDAGAHQLLAAAERALGRASARPSVGVGPDQRAEIGIPLSLRERRIARLVGEGADNAAIAAQLHVGVRTVERLVTNVRRKLAMPSRAALAAHVASRPDEYPG